MHFSSACTKLIINASSREFLSLMDPESLLPCPSLIPILSQKICSPQLGPYLLKKEFASDELWRAPSLYLFHDVHGMNSNENYPIGRH